ncbi:MAG: FAD:protein FMN transferase, partial [Stappiaceae bacterium]
MSLSRRRFMTISAGLALGASVPSAIAAGASTPPTVWRGIALGADAKLVLTGLPKPEAARLIALARAEINRLETIFSLYRTDSVLSELNRTESLENPPPELLNLLSIASAAHTATGGLFDPTIQPLWQAYAEHQGKPPQAAVKAA